ncbi:putative transposable element [Trichonephila clavipes]|nr:putative transposable element [Trichonephila clavipes]
MDWPAYFPDLNPIEHVWDALGRHIAARLHHPENTQQLEQMLIKEWALLPQEMLHQLVLTTRGLLATDHVILNHGQVTWATPVLASPLLTTTPHQREDISALDKFDVHRCPARKTDTVWCALWAGGIIGPYFFKNDEGHKVTVNGDRYRAMITNFFIPELNNHGVQELWFQQDGTTCHTARATIDLLKDTFGDRLISRFGPVNWPPRSCDLTSLDYFLWGYVKSLVYADKPQTLDHLEDNIRRVIADIRPQMLEKVIENWTSRLDYIRASRGSPMPEIIFKI